MVLKLVNRFRISAILLFVSFDHNFLVLLLSMNYLHFWKRFYNDLHKGTTAFKTA